MTAMKRRPISTKLFSKRPIGSSSKHSLTPRRVKFEWQDTPIEWLPGQPFASHFVNEINLLLPAGEFWFCRVYNQALPHITDDKLREDVRAFVRQEAMHARAHGGAVNDYLQAHGIETKSNTDREDWVFEQLLADKPFGRTVPAALQRRWLIFRLGIIAAVEHMTCVLGQYALDNKQWDKGDPMLLDLLRWHGAEEIEHRSVAFDLYRHLGGGYLSRYYLAAITMPVVYGLWVEGAAHIMRQDPNFAAHKPSIFRPWIWREWWQQSKSGVLPSPFWLAAKELSFFTPWYNPEKEGSTEQALAYLQQSPAWHRAQNTELAAAS